MSALALHLDPQDSVASVLNEVAANGTVTIRQANGDTSVLTAITPIPFGHKVALVDIDEGELIIKYGRPIGKASAQIAQGEHVHVHNTVGVESALDSTGAASSPPADSSEATFSAAELTKWVADVAQASGVSPAAAGDLAASLMDAEVTGVKTHGLRRLAPYLERVTAGAMDGHAVPRLVGEGALFEVDGNNAVGAHVLKMAGDAAAQRAKRHGVALALVRNSNHAGALGWLARHLSTQGMISLIISNGPALIAPPECARPFVSNSPIAVGAPLPDGQAFLLDMATSTVSRDRIRQAAEAGASIPLGWAVDDAGNDTTDAQAAMAGAMLPIGGAQRGFALILAFEVLAGVLPGALTDVLVPLKEFSNDPEHIGHFVLVIDPAHTSMGDQFAQRLAAVEHRLLESPVTVGAERPRLPGRRREALRQQALASGIAVSANTLASLERLAADLERPLPIGKER